MQFFYIDESVGPGRNEFDQIYLIGMVWLDEAKLHETERLVRQLAVDVFGHGSGTSSEFHSHEIYAGKGRFKNFSVGKRINVIEALIEIIERVEAKIGYAYIDKKVTYANDHPHQLAFRFLVERIEDQLRSRSEFGLIVADENQQMEQTLTDDLEQFKVKDTGWGWRPTKIEHVADTIHFVRSRHNRIIQLADAACGVMMHGLTTERDLLSRFSKSDLSKNWDDWVETVAKSKDKVNLRLWSRLKRRCVIIKSFP